MTYYTPYTDTLRLTRLLFWAFACLVIACLLLASGALTINDGGFTLSIGPLFVNYGG